MPPKKQCANPLFLQWLEEMRDHAREKGLKSADAFNKGCRSLEQCPVLYERPAQLTELAGIGAKTIAELDKKLRSHCEETGLPYPAPPPRGRKPNGAGAKQTNAIAPQRFLDDDDDEDADEAEEEKDEPPKKKRKSAARPYIPAPRSGAYGILIGMTVAHEDPDDAVEEQLTRGEIIRHAQAFCDSSYDRSDKGTWATAWNSMKTLVEKGYVRVQGSPHRYTLTHDGFDMAAVIRNMDPAFKDQQDLVPFRLRGENAIPTHHFFAASAAASSSKPKRGRPSSSSRAAAPGEDYQVPAPTSGRFSFTYIGRHVDSIAEAASRLCPSEFISLRRIEFLASQRSHSIVKQLRMIDETETFHSSGRITYFAFIVEDGAPPKCSGFRATEKPTAPATAEVAVPKVYGNTDMSLSERAAAAAAARASASRGDSSQTPVPGEPERSRTPSRPAVSAPSVSAPSHPKAPRLSTQMPLPGEHRDVPNFDPTEAVVFPEGTYEIVLVLDTREVESRDNRDRIQETLERKGVKVETRALRLGDMCWIARRLDSFGDEMHECVLDYVVERKRLDDLCSSIQDGRYNEQCFRLGESGIKNVFYIVEDYQKTAKMQFFGKAILTAKSQIQVINGFFLKETHQLNDTIDYLVTMTNVIKRLSRDLKVIPSRHLHRNSYTAFQKHLRKAYPHETFLTSFDAYQAMNKKSSAKTVREYLARMLLRIKGMSPERVSAVLDVWETPRELFEAMRERHGQGLLYNGKKARGPELMFADQVPGEGRRKIGNALSQEMWTMLWGSIPTYPDAPGPTHTTQANAKGKAPASVTVLTTTNIAPRQSIGGQNSSGAAPPGSLSQASTSLSTGTVPTLHSSSQGRTTSGVSGLFVDSKTSTAGMSAGDKLRVRLRGEVGPEYNLPTVGSSSRPIVGGHHLPKPKSAAMVDVIVIDSDSD